MSRFTRAGFVGSVVAFAAFAAGAATPVSAACTSAVIGGKRTCLAAGQRCAHRYERQYEPKGFTCKRNSSGQWRLKRRAMGF
jgi:hypothetical protein